MQEDRECTICPRQCSVDRSKMSSGYCRSGTDFEIATICIHTGEEPVIGGEKGICNIFFYHCNLQCIYCQNYQISNNLTANYAKMPFTQVIHSIQEILDQGVRTVGFVSPSHSIPQIKQIIGELKKMAKPPVFVYNTNAYDRVETLRELEGLIDVYLPDFKYIVPKTAQDYSGAIDYPSVACEAIKEMYRQKGSTLILGEDGIAESGLIIRHLVLPGHADESRKILQYIANQISTSIHISLMSQYYPTENVINHKVLGRILSNAEYQSVIDELDNLGFYRGWVQELESHNNYRPDFEMKHPFER